MKLNVKETFAKLLDTTPIGKIVMYAGNSAPRGWLLCQGQAVSRTTYAKLYSVIGTTYGTGDGSTTFNVPDMRGRVPTGVGTCDGVTYNLGDKKNAGVPNITGHVDIKGHTGSAEYYAQRSVVDPSGAFRSGTAHSPAGYQAAQLFSQYYAPSLDFDAQGSDSHYGASTTVQPNTTVTNFLIYVGG